MKMKVGSLLVECDKKECNLYCYCAVSSAREIFSYPLKTPMLRLVDAEKDYDEQDEFKRTGDVSVFYPDIKMNEYNIYCDDFDNRIIRLVSDEGFKATQPYTDKDARVIHDRLEEITKDAFDAQDEAARKSMIEGDKTILD